MLGGSSCSPPRHLLSPVQLLTTGQGQSRMPNAPQNEANASAGYVGGVAMQYERSLLHTQGDRRRGRSKVAGAVVLTAVLFGVLVVSSSSPAGSQSLTTGRLDLLASNAAGDGFRYVPSSGTALTETFTTSQQGEITGSTGSDLVSLASTGKGADVVLVKDHRYGVRAQGEGTGTPASQINISTASADAQTLTISFNGANLPFKVAWKAQVSLKLKFGATARIKAFLGTNPVPVVSAAVPCVGAPVSDCGPDSGLDRSKVVIGDGATTLFDRIVISIDSPLDGAASLIDVDGLFDTWFDMSPFEGILACDGAAAVQSSGDVASSFARLTVDIGTVVADCGTLKPYAQDIVGTVVEFEPDAALQAVYRGELTFPAGTGAAFFDPLEYDEDGAGAAVFEDMQPCLEVAVTIPPTGGTLTGATQLAGYFPEMDDGFYPELPAGESACVVSYSTVAGGLEHWVIRLDYDPWFR